MTGAAPPFIKSSTSARVTLPLGPVPGIKLMFRPLSLANLRTGGVDKALDPDATY